jgi:hypothetical protein
MGPDKRQVASLPAAHSFDAAARSSSRVTAASFSGGIATLLRQCLGAETVALGEDG